MFVCHYDPLVHQKIFEVRRNRSLYLHLERMTMIRLFDVVFLEDPAFR